MLNDKLPIIWGLDWTYFAPSFLLVLFQFGCSQPPDSIGVSKKIWYKFWYKLVQSERNQGNPKKCCSIIIEWIRSVKHFVNADTKSLSSVSSDDWSPDSGKWEILGWRGHRERQRQVWESQAKPRIYLCQPQFLTPLFLHLLSLV